MPPATGMSLSTHDLAAHVDTVVVGQQARRAVDDVVAGGGQRSGREVTGRPYLDRPAIGRPGRDVVVEADGLVDGVERVEAVGSWRADPEVEVDLRRGPGR